MEMMKRRRDPAFTTSEKMYLIELIEKHFAIIECKKTDTYTMKNKNEEWQKLATEFNAISGIHPRLPAVLKNCWENLKKRAKQGQTSRNQHYMGTGGGPPKKEKEDPVTDKVLELIQARVSGYVNTFDSDGTQILASTSMTPEDAIQIEYQEATTDTIESQTEVKYNSEQPSTSADVIATLEIDWSQHTPSMLKQPANSVLRRSPSPCDIQQELHTPNRNISERAPHTHVTAYTSRKRPPFKRECDSKSVIEERVNSLKKANTQAEEEHKLKMNILHLQEQKEIEILKQEQLKTKQEALKLEILELQFKKIKE